MTLESVFRWLLSIAAFYALLGFVFAGVFLVRWRAAFDPAALAGTWGFRLLILPGLVALWPLMLRKVRQLRAGQESAGAAEPPVSPETLRLRHYRRTLALAAAGCALFAVALLFRAPRLEDSPETPITLSPR